LEREAVHGAERKHDRILERRGLKLEIEAPAEALAEREPPCLVDPRAVRRVHDEMTVAGLVEKALEDDALVRRQPAERRFRGTEVVDELRGRGGREAVVSAERLGDVARGADLEPVIDTRAKLGDRARQLVAAPRGLAEPERNPRRLAARVLDVDLAGLDLADSVRRVAELEDL